LELQRAASVLVNPRRPEGEFTKYSFPSKTMEYLASSKQVIMHRLPGMPPEYLEHLTIPATPDASGLAQALRAVSARSKDERAISGAQARAFILASKSPDAQVTRVLDHWAKLRDSEAAREITGRGA
jgi:glycosyltransferase involved in cell wall biosynthesis